MKMLECRIALTSKGLMQQLEMSLDRQLLAGMVARAVGVTMLTEVGNDCADGRHEPAYWCSDKPSPATIDAKSAM